MKKMHAAIAALVLAAFVLCGCSASGRVSTEKNGIIREEHEDVRREDEGLIDDITEKDTTHDSRADMNKNAVGKNDGSLGTAANGR